MQQRNLDQNQTIRPEKKSLKCFAEASHKFNIYLQTFYKKNCCQQTDTGHLDPSNSIKYSTSLREI